MTTDFQLFRRTMTGNQTAIARTRLRNQTSDANTSMKNLKRLLSQHRKRKKRLPESSHKSTSLFNAISSLPDELLLPILRNIYPLEAFRKYNPYTNRGTVAFWDTILMADQIMISISKISERFREISAVILEELVKSTKAFITKCDSWETINGVHRKYREDSEWQWGYSVVCG